MIDGKRVLSVILARGGSKGLPNKNIRILSGIPLIEHTIKHVICSKYVDKVVVSSDSDEICNIGRSNSCDAIKRPDYLSSDISPSEDSLIHAIQNTKGNYDIVAFPQVTHPIRRPGLIDLCLEKMQDTNSDSLVSVKSFSPFFFHIDKNGETYINPKSGVIHRKMRQQMVDTDLFFMDIGNLYIVVKDVLLNRRSRIGLRPCLFELNDDECIDIHCEKDLDLAGFCMEKFK